MFEKNRPFVVNQHISLRPPLAELANPIFKIVYHQRAYLRQWLPWVDHTKTVKDTAIFLEESRIFNDSKKRFTTFIFWEDELVGSIGFVNIDEGNKIGEIGYWLHQEYQGKGIVGQTCKTLVAYGFTKLQLNRIEIKVASKNQKSRAIPNRLGFQHEATLREALQLYETFHDLEIYSLLHSEWKLD